MLLSLDVQKWGRNNTVSPLATKQSIFHLKKQSTSLTIKSTTVKRQSIFLCYKPARTQAQEIRQIFGLCFAFLARLICHLQQALFNNKIINEHVIHSEAYAHIYWYIKIILPPFLNISLFRDSTRDYIRMYIDALKSICSLILLRM